MMHFREVENLTQSHTADLGQSQEASQEPSQAWQSLCCPAPAHRALLSHESTPQATGVGGHEPMDSADPPQTAAPLGAGKLASLWAPWTSLPLGREAHQPRPSSGHRTSPGTCPHSLPSAFTTSAE